MDEPARALISFEVWRPIPGADGAYEASDLGRIRSVDRMVPCTLSSSGYAMRKGRVLVAPVSGKYRHVNWISGGKRVNFDVHRLVCLTFHGEPDPGQEVRHLDGDKLNNCAYNLAWGSKSENQKDKIRHGTNHELNKTHCKAGHRYTEDNTYRAPSSPNKRKCRQCMRLSDARRRTRRR